MLQQHVTLPQNSLLSLQGLIYPSIADIGFLRKSQKTEQCRMEGTSRNHLLQTSAQSSVNFMLEARHLQT